MTSQPVRVALINDHPLVVQGLRGLLEDCSRVDVVELDTLVDVSRPVDVALLDTFSQAQPIARSIAERLGQPTVRRVALFTWSPDPALVADALAAGASGVIAKTIGRTELVAALERISRGDIVVAGAPPATSDLPATSAPRGRDWPGRSHGLSMREAEMVCLIAHGMSNHEIAERLHLSLNSVKTHVRTAYAKIGVTSRSQAVIWAHEHGMRPRPSRERRR